MKNHTRPLALLLGTAMLFAQLTTPALAAAEVLISTPEQAAPAADEAAPQTLSDIAPAGNAGEDGVSCPSTVDGPLTETGEEAPAEVFNVENSLSIEKTGGGELTGTDFNYENNLLTIKSSTPMTISGTTTTDKIVIQDGLNGANLTLDGASIKVGDCAFKIGTGSTVNLTVQGETNTLQSGNGNAGLYVPEGSALTLLGDGNLSASGGITPYYWGGAAGIGSNSNEANYGTITIKMQGTLRANGEARAAGIGGGGFLDAPSRTGSVIIESGTVFATGGVYSPGICGLPTNSSGSFTTGAGEKPIIYASCVNGWASIGDTTHSADWHGIIFNNNDGRVYGTQTLPNNYVFQSDKSLTIGNGSLLTVNGSLGSPNLNNITVENGGFLTCKTLTGNGDVSVAGTLSLTGALNCGKTFTMQNGGTIKGCTDLTASGNIKLTGSVSITGKLHSDANLTIDKDATLTADSAEIAGDFLFNGAMNCNSLEVKGNTAVNKPITCKSFINTGNMDIPANSKLTCETLSAAGILTVFGNLDASTRLTINNELTIKRASAVTCKSLENNGNIYVEGMLTLDEGDTYTGDGKLYGYGGGNHIVNVAPQHIASAYTRDGLTLTGGVLGTDYVYQKSGEDGRKSNTFLIVGTSPISISGTTTTVGVEVSGGITVDITLNNASITHDTIAPFALIDGAAVNLTLNGTNVLYHTQYYAAGLQVPKGTTLTITKNSDGSSLVAESHSNGAGIGGGRGTEEQTEFACAGTIIINGGNITATGGSYSAGIGGGYGPSNSQILPGDGGNITINGGIVTAYSGQNAAGIGGGLFGDGGQITINGGTVVAHAYYADFGYLCSGAAIGGGETGAGGIINITGGHITAEVAPHGGGAAIGGGCSSEKGAAGGTITISGGTVIAKNGTAEGWPTGVYGAGIGAGGGKSLGESGDFSTGDNGHAVILTSSISDQSKKEDSDNPWQGLIYESEKTEDQCKLYGTTIEITESAELPDGANLTINKGQTLTIGAGLTLTNKGSILNSGTVDASKGTLAGNKIKNTTSTSISFNGADGGPLPTASPSAVYGKQIALVAAVSQLGQVVTNPPSTLSGMVSFYVGEGEGTPLGSASFGTDGKAALTMTQDIWENNAANLASPGNKEITARLTATDTLAESEGSKTLNITEAQKHTLSFDTQGGSEAPPKIEIVNGFKLGNRMPTPEPTKAGHTFSGWFTAPTGGTQITGETVLTENTTAYARWTPIPITLTLDFQGKGKTTTITVNQNQPVGKVLPSPSYSGYRFDGWFDEEVGGIQINDKSTFSKNTTLYAHWTKKYVPPVAVPTPTASPTSKPTPSPRPSPTPTAVPTPTTAPTPTASPKPTASPTAGPTAAPADKVAAFVTRLYKVCLGRAPDAAGLEYWVNQLKTQSATGSTAAHGFVFSEEFTGKNYSDTDFIKQLYRAFMGREADAEGLAGWVNALANGMTREDAFNGFAISAEFANLCEDYGISAGSASFVSRLYKVCMGRRGSATDIPAWAVKLQSGGATGRDVAYGFIFSQEFTGKNYSDTDFVKQLYRALMGREADTTGLSGWVAKLSAGATREEVFDGFIGSDEFTALCKANGIKRG